MTTTVLNGSELDRAFAAAHVLRLETYRCDERLASRLAEWNAAAGPDEVRRVAGPWVEQRIYGLYL